VVIHAEKRIRGTNSPHSMRSSINYFSHLLTVFKQPLVLWPIVLGMGSRTGITERFKRKTNVPAMLTYRDASHILLKNKTKRLAIADKPPDACARRCSMLCCQKLPSGEWLRFIGRISRLLSTPLSFDNLNEEDPLELWRSCFGMEKLEGLDYITLHLHYITILRWPKVRSNC